jgi:hypothetical protein
MTLLIIIDNNNLIKMIRGLGDYKKEDDGNKKKTTSYTGGEKSGMAVENPPDNDIESIVQ